MINLIKHVVVAAVIRSEDQERIYIQRRPEEKEYGGQWELPGGKVEEGETFEEALERELSEELDRDNKVVFYVSNFISAAVKTGTEGSAWVGEQYLLVFFNVGYGRIGSQFITPVAKNFMWVGKNQLVAFNSVNENMKMCHEDLEVLKMEFSKQ